MFSCNSFGGRKFRSMLFTATVSVFTQFATLLIDKVLTGRLLGEQALAVISLFSPFFSLVFFASTCISVGCAVCFSIYIGEMRRNKASSFMGLGLALSLVVGCVLGGAFFLANDWIVEKFAYDAQMIPFVQDFTRFFPLFILIAPVYAVLQEMVYVDGEHVFTHLSYVVLFLGNVILSVILCGNFGFSGIVLGTVLSLLLAIAALVPHFFRKNCSLRFNFHFRWANTFKVLRYSAVESSEFLFLTILFLIMNHYFAVHFGSGSLVVLSVVLDMIELSIVFGGVWQATEPVLNVYRAERNGKAVRNMMNIVNLTLIVESIVVFLLFFAFAPWFVGMFHIQTQEIYAQAVNAVRCVSFGLFGIAFVKVYASYYLHEKPVFSVFLISLVFLIVPVSSLVPASSLGGMVGVWLSIVFSSYFTLVVGGIAFGIFFGLDRFPLLLNHAEIRKFFVKSMVLTDENIIVLRNRADEVCRKMKVCDRSRYKIMLLVEELGMLCTSLNAPRKVFGEFSFCVEDDYVNVFYKDDGIIVDMTDLEQKLSDLRSYVVSSFMANHRDKLYVLTVSFNRHAFRFPKENRQI